MTRRRRVATAAAAAAAVGLLGLGSVAWAPPATAHASLVSTSPEDGAVLTEAPAAVVLEFSDAMAAPAYVVVTGPAGDTLATSEPVVDGATVTQPLTDGAAEVPDGSYTVAFRAVSVDGHPVTGQLGFAVGSPTAASPGATGTDPGAPAATAGPPADGGTGPAATDAPADDASGAALGPQLAVGAGLFAIAGLLLWLSRRAA